MYKEGKEAFIKEIESITENFEEPCPLEIVLSQEAYQFFLDLKEGKFDKTATEEKKNNGGLTDNGKSILIYMRNCREACENKFTAKEIGEGMGLSGRSISGTIRSMVKNGYVEKISQSPVTYALTNKGIETEI